MKQILAIGEALRQRLFAGSCHVLLHSMGKNGTIVSYPRPRNISRVETEQKGLSSYGNV